MGKAKNLRAPQAWRLCGETAMQDQPFRAEGVFTSDLRNRDAPTQAGRKKIRKYL